MKGKVKSIISFALVVLVLVGIISYNVYATEKENKEQKMIVYNAQKSAYDDLDDGWVYVFSISYPENSNDDNMYMFDGYNLKYKELEGYYVPVIDQMTGKEISRVIPNYITLSISEKYKRDIVRIGDFFNKKQFKNSINMEDLKDLYLQNFSKEYIMNLFNKAINSVTETKPGNYYSSSFVDKISVDSTDIDMKGEWQLSYLVNFGYITHVNIEFIDENDKYLSDKENITSEELKLVREIEQLENNLVEQQYITGTANINSDTSNLSVLQNPDIQKLLNLFNEI